ncbi:MAG: hydroxymethylglutaryl-CoA lyase [Pseudomonadota bacterium]
MHNPVEIIEVSPRDGIQNEQTLLSTDDKLALIQMAIDSGASRIEVTSFVNPKRVPQMADADEVASRLPPNSRSRYIGLALNKRGYQRACNAALDEANYVVVASDTFARRNQGTDTEGTLNILRSLTDDISNAIPVGVTVATAFGCPFDGEVPLTRLMEVVDASMETQPFEIALADTIGVATPKDVKERVDAVKQRYPDVPVRLHFHNTRNTGYANAWAGIEAGATALDASFGGVGGCPFAPRATGNIATEDLVYMLERAGVDTGVSSAVAIDAAIWLEGKLQKIVPGMVMKAGLFPS